MSNRASLVVGILIGGTLIGLMATGFSLFLIRNAPPVRVEMTAFPTPVPTHTPQPTHTPRPTLTPTPTPHPTPAAGDAVVRLAVSTIDTLNANDLSPNIHHIRERRMTLPVCPDPVGIVDAGAYWWILIPIDETLTGFQIGDVDALSTMDNTNPLTLDGDDYNSYRTNRLRCGNAVRSGLGGKAVTVSYARRS